ncbi:hypothetical protein [Rhodovulum euryhalinum]|uniref:Tail protein n=1 Tax=Rhodovulum euryhalinum TaxID=35805 RepID=A0A4R2K968_9RHOB|nr:hypothetical protein [Rhodovulum euryhalinum]TCO68507.1 hypothetical protein EV655_12714 [Rhodovulum euryhalinum]
MIPELPPALVAGLERRLVTASAVALSPFTGTAQVQDWGGEWWAYSIDLAPRQGREARRLAAFLAALGGVRGTFLFRDPTARPAGSVGAPVVAGGFQAGARLATGRWAPGGTALLAGDLVSLGTGAATRLHQLTEDVVADADGRATLALVPRLREAPSDGAPLEIAAPAVVLRLTGPVPATVGRADTWRFSLSAREAL